MGGSSSTTCTPINNTLPTNALQNYISTTLPSSNNCTVLSSSNGQNTFNCTIPNLDPNNLPSSITSFVNNTPGSYCTPLTGPNNNLMCVISDAGVANLSSITPTSLPANLSSTPTVSTPTVSVPTVSVPTVSVPTTSVPTTSVPTTSVPVLVPTVPVSVSVPTVPVSVPTVSTPTAITSSSLSN